MLAGRACCIAAKKMGDGDYAALDPLLRAMSAAHAEFCAELAGKARRVFRQFDADGDGRFSADEFKELVSQLDSDIETADAEELRLSSILSHGAAGGASPEPAADGAASLDLEAMEAKLFDIGRLHKLAAMPVAKEGQRAGGVQLGVALAAREELGVLIALWNSIRDLPDDEAAGAGADVGGAAAGAAALGKGVVDELLAKWSLAVRLQAWLRGAVYRWRRRAERGAGPKPVVPAARFADYVSQRQNQK